MPAPKISIKRADVRFRNFAGAPTKFNAKGGVRDFVIVLDNYEDIQQLIDMGFNLKYFNKKDPADPDVPFLKVKVNFRFDEETGTKLISPHIYLVERDPSDPEKIVKKTLVTPSIAAIADNADVEYYDVVITPYRWEVNGNTGVAAYLDKMYMNLVIDEFESKYEVWSDPEEDNAEPIPFE